MSKKNKKTSSYVLVALGSSIALGGIFTVLSMQTFGKVDLVVATSDIAAYSRPFVIEDFKEIRVSKGDRAHFKNFVNDANALVGKVPSADITAELPVRPNQVVDPTNPEQVNSIVLDENYRGLYLPISYDGALNGELLNGSIADFFLMVKSPKPSPGKPDDVEWVVRAFQKSYDVKKVVTTEDGMKYVFFEFPKEESEQYIMLKESLSGENMKLIATMPNPLHEEYDGKSLNYTEFFNSVLANPEYFSDLSETTNSDKADTEINVENNFDDVNVEKPSTDSTENTPDKKS